MTDTATPAPAAKPGIRSVIVGEEWSPPPVMRGRTKEVADVIDGGLAAGSFVIRDTANDEPGNWVHLQVEGGAKVYAQTIRSYVQRNYPALSAATHVDADDCVLHVQLRVRRPSTVRAGSKPRGRKPKVS